MRFRSRPRPAIAADVLYQLARDADGFVHTERGYISARNYEKLREASPDLKLPRWVDLPRICDLPTQDLAKLRQPRQDATPWCEKCRHWHFPDATCWPLDERGRTY